MEFPVHLSSSTNVSDTYISYNSGNKKDNTSACRMQRQHFYNTLSVGTLHSTIFRNDSKLNSLVSPVPKSHTTNESVGNSNSHATPDR